MEYVLYGEDVIGQTHRDVDWRPHSYSTCQLRKEVLGECTHCNTTVTTSASEDKVTLRAKLSGAVYCYRSCLLVCVCVCLCVCLFVDVLPR